MQHLRSIVTRLNPSRFKKTVRWLILGAVLFFLGKTLKDHWQEVAQIRIDAAGWASLAIAIGITLLAHIFTGYVWTLILKELAQPVRGEWGVRVYLKTNIAKYLPGNIWHFYGRISFAKQAEIPTDVATLSVLLEPLLMVAAACIIGLGGLAQFGTHKFVSILQVFLLVGTLGVIHPRFLNPLLQRVAKLKQKPSNSSPSRIQRYPVLPLVGEMGFLVLRAIGFIFTFLAIAPTSAEDFPLLIGAYAWAWLLGFIIPGLPGGVGVFEAAAIAFLGQHFPAGQVISTVALYRLVNTLAETLGAGLVVIDEKRR